jgi:PilZ domain
MHSIRSSNQRALATHWNALATDRGFPAISAFNPQATNHSPEQMIVWDVENAGEAGRSFRVRSVGLRAVEAIGDSPIGPIGKTMEELAPPPLREISLNGARECVTSGCAIYEIITTVDANAHVVECERLLLPFGDGEHVEQIVAALQLISFQGAIERQGFAREFVGRPQLTFTGMILSDAMTRKGPAAMAARFSQTNGTSAPVQAATDTRERVEPGSEQQPAADQRKAARRTVLKTARIRYGKSSEICTVRDMSATGASIDAAGAASVPDRFELVLEMESAARKCTVVWRKDRQLGVRFG